MVGAFLVTNQQWTKIKQEQQAINIQFERAADQITKLNELEEQKQDMINKAELAAALVERVPRSILLAELINRMPPRLGLLELHLSSDRIKPVRGTVERGGLGTLDAPQRARTKEEAMAEARKLEPPKYDVVIEMVGVAPTDLEVSSYKGDLASYALLDEVELLYTEEKELEGRRIREFRIRARLDPDADVRQVKPLVVPRTIKNPMLDTVQHGNAPVSGPRSVVQGVEQKERGD